MTRTLTRDEIHNLQAQLKDARCIHEVLRLARTRRIERVPGGYRITRHAHARGVEYTADDLAWFRRPLRSDGGAL